MVWGGGTVGVPSGLAVDCAGSHPRCVVARLYPGVGHALVQTWVPVLGTVEGAIVSLGPRRFGHVAYLVEMGCNYPRRSMGDSWWVVGSGIRCTTGHRHRNRELPTMLGRSEP